MPTELSLTHAPDADTIDESGKATSPSKSAAPAAKSAKSANIKQTPPVAATGAPPKRNTKPATRRGKVGRNQYTKDREIGDTRSIEARPIHSRDGDDGNGSSDGQAALLPNGSRPAKQKHMNPNRTSMNEMRKRAAGILEFISRTQIEMAVDKPTSDGDSPPAAQAAGAVAASATSSSSNSAKGLPNGSSKLANEIRSEPDEDKAAEAISAETPTTTSDDRPKMEDIDFKSLDTLRMMDVLSREIHHWQQVHGKWGSAAREVT